MYTYDRPTVDERAAAFDIACDSLVVSDEVIHRLGMHTAEEGIGEFPDVPQEAKYPISDSQKYVFFLGNIARRQVTEGLEAAGYESSRFIRAAFDSGLSTIGGFIKQGIGVYKDSTNHPDVDEFAGILHRSYPAIARFARTNNTTSQTLEGIYNLGTRMPNDIEGRRGFVLTEEPFPRLTQSDWDQSLLRVTGRLALADDPTQLEIATRQIYGGEIKCGAYEKLLPKAFHWAVDFTTQAHEFIPSDLARIMEQA